MTEILLTKDEASHRILKLHYPKLLDAAMLIKERGQVANLVNITRVYVDLRYDDYELVWLATNKMYNEAGGDSLPIYIGVQRFARTEDGQLLWPFED